MKTSKIKIVVFGCTGTVGRYVLEELTNKDCHVIGVLRNAKREHPIPIAEADNLSYVIADLKSKTDVEHACTGVDTIFLLTATHPDQVTYESNVIQSAMKHGVTRIVKLSAPDIRPSHLVKVSEWHRAIEEELKSSGIDYCCIRPYAFMQNWERNTTTIRQFSTIYGAMGDASRNYVDARDVAEVAVSVLLQDSPIEQNIITLTGPEALSHHDMAGRLTSVTGRRITYKNTSSSKLKKMLTGRAKLPNWLAEHIVELDELAIKVPEPTTSNVSRYLSKEPRRMQEYLNENKLSFEKTKLWELVISLF